MTALAMIIGMVRWPWPWEGQQNAMGRAVIGGYLRDGCNAMFVQCIQHSHKKRLQKLWMQCHMSLITDHGFARSRYFAVVGDRRAGRGDRHPGARRFTQAARNGPIPRPFRRCRSTATQGSQRRSICRADLRPIIGADLRGVSGYLKSWSANWCASKRAGDRRNRGAGLDQQLLQARRSCQPAASAKLSEAR